MSKKIVKEAILDEICSHNDFLFTGEKTQTVGLMMFSKVSIKNAIDELVAVGVICEKSNDYHNLVMDDFDEYEDYDEYDDCYDFEECDECDESILYVLGTARNIVKKKLNK